jgi:tetratricopeptide (TPR) repeat protein
MPRKDPSLGLGTEAPLTDHPPPALLRRFLRGSLTVRESGRLFAHLRGCRSCRNLRPPESSPRRTSSGAAPAAHPGAGREEAGRQPRRAPRRRRLLASELTKAAPVLAAIMAGKLRFADLSGAQRRQVWGAPLVETLVEASQAVRFDDPHQMLEVAQLARRAVERMEVRYWSAEVVADLRARTSAELANAYRLTDNFRAAWKEMSQAIRGLSSGTGDLLVVARVATLTASLLAYHRRFDEVTELMDPLVHLYGQLGDRHLVGRALISKAAFAQYAYQHEEALRLALAGAELIDPEQEPALLVTVLLTILISTLEAGRCRQARILLWRMRAMGLIPNDRVSMLRFRWAEARMYAGLGDHERAERAFSQAREGLKKLGLVASTAVCGLDLAVLRVQEGRRAEAETLIEELIPVFCDLGIARETLACLLLLREV